MSDQEIETEIKVLRAMMKALSPRTTMSKAAKDIAMEVRMLEGVIHNSTMPLHLEATQNTNEL